MKSRRLHSWTLSACEGIALQKELAHQLRTAPIRPAPKLVAGCDVSYSRGSDSMFAGAIVLRLPGFNLVEEVWTVRRSEFPYVPGLLSFREGPAVLDALTKLRTRPDAVIFDGQGRAHTRGLGLAAHIGLWLQVPTVGCAKSRLVGDETAPGPRRGERTPLKLKGRIIGSVLRTRDNVKPVYVSAGHLANLADSVRLVLRCGGGFRLPEPTRQAHALVNRVRVQVEGPR